MLDQIKKGTVAVLSMDGKMIAGGWGQVTSKIAHTYGCVGALVDGPVRDIVQIAHQKFPVFAKGLHPASIRGRMKLGTIDESVECGGQVIKNGDFIFGDQVGVVVVPRGELEKVVSLSRYKSNQKATAWQIPV